MTRLPTLMHISVTGPECCGKTTLCEQLVTELGGITVPEMALLVLPSAGGYSLKDISRIALLQQKTEEAARRNNQIVISDTDAVVLMVWAKYRFNKIPGEVLEYFETSRPDIYLLCKPDLDWQPGLLRENPIDREFLFGMYLRILRGNNRKYEVISGLGTHRLSSAMAAISSIKKGP